MIYLYTGPGEGKTSAALGHALRALGHQMDVVVVQFLKGWKNTGIAKLKNKIKNLKIYQFGKRSFTDFKNLTPTDYLFAEKGFEFVKNLVKKNPPDLLILDEINLILAYKLIPLDSFLEFLENLPKKTHLILTGRKAPKELRERADLITYFKEIKHPFQKGIKAKRGLDY